MRKSRSLCWGTPYSKAFNTFFEVRYPNLPSSSCLTICWKNVRCFFLTRPGTFSIKKKLGRKSQIRLANVWVSFPLLPSAPRSFPAWLKSWQGGPPITPKNSGVTEPNASFKMMRLVRLSMLDWLTRGQSLPLARPTACRQLEIPARYISANEALTSFDQTTSKPDCSNPKSRKPPPEKNDNNGIRSTV